MATKLTPVRTFADTAVQSGTSGTLEVSIPSRSEQVLYGIVVTNNSVGNPVSAMNLSTPSPNDVLSMSSIQGAFGVNIFRLVDPPYTPGISTQTITATLTGSYTFAMCAIVFELCDQSNPDGLGGLDAQVTGDPNISGLIVENNDYLIDAVYCASNTLAVSAGTEIMNLVSGGNTYASSYRGPLTASTISQTWVRQGTPTNAVWRMLAMEVNSTTPNARIINS